MTVNSSSWKKMQIADRDQPFDADDAIKRLFDRAAEPGSAFFWMQTGADPKNKESYRLPFADVIDGKLILVPHAIYAAANLLSGGHGGLPGIPDKEKDQIRDVISEIYIKLRDTFSDPRIRPPWDRGQPPERRSDANMTIDEAVDSTVQVNVTSPFMADGTPPFYSIATTNPTTTTITVSTFANDKDPKKPYGDVEYADPGYQGDGISRYPVDTEKHVRAAWGYINQPDNADKYSPEDLKKVRDKIMAAAKKIGIEISEESEEMTTGPEPDGDCPEGQHKMPDGTCMDDDDPSMDDGYTLVAAGAMRPPREWFNDPKLKGPTRLQITEDGRVLGHLAQWGQCHTGIGNSCVNAPKSVTNYSFFKNGEVVCADGSHLAVGKISLGGGHAAPGLGYIPALTHYDSTSSCVAVVNTGEDRYGIWVAGSVVPGLDEERLAALRRSPLSGDWRRVGGNLELVAALCVNTPGFPIVKMSQDLQLSLVAAGVVERPNVVDLDAEARDVAERLEELRKWQNARRFERLINGKRD